MDGEALGCLLELGYRHLLEGGGDGTRMKCTRRVTARSSEDLAAVVGWVFEVWSSLVFNTMGGKSVERYGMCDLAI